MKTLRPLIGPLPRAIAVLITGVLAAALTSHGVARTPSSDTQSLKTIANIVVYAHHHATQIAQH